MEAITYLIGQGYFDLVARDNLCKEVAFKSRASGAKEIAMGNSRGKLSQAEGTGEAQSWVGTSLAVPGTESRRANRWGSVV